MLINKAILFSLILTSILCSVSSIDSSQKRITFHDQEQAILYYEKMLNDYEELKKQNFHNDKAPWQPTVKKAFQPIVNTLLFAEKAVQDNCLEPCCIHCCLPCLDTLITWYFSNPEHTSK